jgi:hypothetical protein
MILDECCGARECIAALEGTYAIITSCLGNSPSPTGYSRDHAALPRHSEQAAAVI